MVSRDVSFVKAHYLGFNHLKNRARSAGSTCSDAYRLANDVVDSLSISVSTTSLITSETKAL